MRFITKKRVAAAAAAAVIAGGGMAAYAYFTTTGSGTGSGTTGTNSAVTLHASTSPSLYPGSSATVTFTADNPSSGHQYVTTIHLGSVTTDVAHSSCVMSDYVMTDVTANADLAPGNGQAIAATGTLTMSNNGNQDACKGAPLTLNLTSS